MEDTVFRDTVRPDRYPRSALTAREQQVLELVEQGSKNKEIAQELGIRGHRGREILIGLRDFRRRHYPTSGAQIAL